MLIEIQVERLRGMGRQNWYAAGRSERFGLQFVACLLEDLGPWPDDRHPNLVHAAREFGRFAEEAVAWVHSVDGMFLADLREQ